MKKVIIVDNALDTSIIDNFLPIIDKNKFITIDKSTYAQTQTNFQIKFYKDDFHISHKYQSFRHALLLKVEEIAEQQIPTPSVFRHFMLKYNEPGMRSALHVEHNDVHGNLGFLFYFTTESSGYLKWVDKEKEKEYFKKYPDEKQVFLDNFDYRQFYGNIDVQPVYNRLVVFETFGSHYVDTLIDSRNEIPRLCIMGWPLARF